MNALTPNVDRGDADHALSRVILEGDLSRLTPAEKVTHYNATCQSLGLNPLTRPLEYIRLNGKEVLYARKDCTDQLRALRRVSVQVVDRSIADGIVVVTARATTPDGRSDEEIGAVPLGNLAGEARANALMKAMTKAKRRVTLSICGLGFLDETEVESIPAAPMPVQSTRVDPSAPRDVSPPTDATQEWPVLHPKGHTDKAMSAGQWVRWCKTAIGRLESGSAVAKWQTDMEVHFEALEARDPAAVRDVRQAVSDRLDHFALQGGAPMAEGDAQEPSE